MTSHELADRLLAMPNLPIATHANNHDYFSVADKQTHGELKVALCKHYTGDYVMIGNMYRKDLNYPNWYLP
jgi:hypothetical protein